MQIRNDEKKGVLNGYFELSWAKVKGRQNRGDHMLYILLIEIHTCSYHRRLEFIGDKFTRFKKNTSRL